MNIRPYRRKAYYYETDRMDIVHHSNYVRWLEETRVDLLEQIGCPFAEIEKRGLVSPVLSVETNYRFPVRFGDEFERLLVAVLAGRSKTAFIADTSLITLLFDNLL